MACNKTQLSSYDVKTVVQTLEYDEEHFLPAFGTLYDDSVGQIDALLFAKLGAGSTDLALLWDFRLSCAPHGFI